MRTGFVAHYNPHDRRAWSGTYAAIIQQLKKHHEVEPLFEKLNFFEKEYLFEQRNWYKWFKKENLVVDFLKAYSKFASRKLDRMIKDKDLQLLIAPASNQRFAYSKTKLPIIIVADAPFVGLNQYYQAYSNLPERNIREAIEMDKRAYEKAAHCIMASDWAASLVINNYGVDPRKISVVPFGANLHHLPGKEEVKANKDDTCRLLFLGLDWQRKGGDITLNTFNKLKKKGLKTKLHVIGCVPPEPTNDDDITVIPFLNKNKPEEEKQLFDILKEADFLILPTRAECAGIVFCEASAFGLPIVTTDTGGVGTYVRNNENGLRVSYDDNGEQYAEYIYETFSDRERYLELRRSARELYEKELNWEAWGEYFNRVIEKVMSNK